MKPKLIALAMFGLISVSLLYPLRSYAFLGVADVVIDPTHIAATVAGWAQQAIRFLTEQTLKAMLANLKRRLLDTITDQMVTWIQGGGKPKFLRNFGDTLNTAAKQAVGDVAQEVGLARLCQPFREPLLRVTVVQPPRFSRQVSCTLDNIVSNINDFYNNFGNGGWIAYQEIQRPQNNYYGALAQVLDEQTRRASEAQAAASQEAAANQGFIATKVCREWTGVTFTGGSLTNGYGAQEVVKAVSSDFNYPDPDQAPPDGTANAVGWKCKNPQITTPGTAVAEALNRSLFSNVDFIVNSNDITDAVAAIFDAGINRLIKGGVQGLQRMTLSETSTGVPATGSLPDAAAAATNTYQNGGQSTIVQTRQSLNNQIDNALQSLTNASSALTTVQTQNNALIQILQNALTACASNLTNYYWAQNALGTANSSTTQQISDKSATIGTLTQSLNTAKSQVQTAQNLADLNTLTANITDLATQSQNLLNVISDLRNQIINTTDVANTVIGICTRH